MTTLTNTLEQENLQLKKENQSLKNELKFLNEQFEWFRRQLFGKRSEKVIEKSDNQLYLPGLELIQPTEKIKKNIPAHTRTINKDKDKSKLTFPENLPVERTILDLDEKDKVCKETGKPLVKIGEDVTQKLAHRPGSYFIKETVRPKYAGSKDGEKTIISAAQPDSILSNCKVDESFAAEVLVKKFADHLPLYRQSEILSREGINASRQFLSQLLVKCGEGLKPLYEKMSKMVLESNNVFVDEVPVSMLSPGKGSVHQAYMWVLVGGKEANPAYRIYDFRTTRQHMHVDELLKNYQGVLHSDKYGAYEKLAQKKQIVWCPCWAHIRRKFFEAGGGKNRDYVLTKINELFWYEEQAWTKSEEERLEIRKQLEEPIIDELILLIKDELINGHAMAKSKYKEALGYFCSLIPYIKNYITEAFARLDNNVAERAVRPLVIGRKNWLFLGSKEGGEAAATILSLVQTCRALKINPREYLEDIMRRIMSHNSQKLEELLPDNWLKEKISKSNQI